MIAGLKPYPTYTESDIGWLGPVPGGWAVRRMKTLFHETNERDRASEPLLAATQTKGVIRKDEYEHRTVEALTNLESLKFVDRNDFVISLRSFEGGIERAHASGIISPAYTVLRAIPPAAPEYLALLLKSRSFIDGLRVFVTGIREGQNIDYSKLGRSGLPLPPPQDQAAIVRYLDHIDSRIQRFIAAKERLIELLEEEKRAIIHRAVTRGFDADVPLESSGVDGIGKIPSHWGVLPFKRVLGFREGPGIGASDFRDEGVPLLRIAGMKGAEASLAGCNYLDPRQVDERWSQFRIELHDYLLSASASAGEVVPASPDVVGAIPYTGIIRLWPIRSSAHMPFVAHFLRSRPFRAQVEVMASGVAIQHFGPTHLKRAWIALPPIEEQRRIVDALDSQLGGYAVAVDTARRQIELVREYRTRLISDVATGKVDARHAVRQLPAGSETDISGHDEQLEEAVA